MRHSDGSGEQLLACSENIDFVCYIKLLLLSTGTVGALLVINNDDSPEKVTEKVNMSYRSLNDAFKKQLFSTRKIFFNEPLQK